jgi:transposase-like protein
MSSILSQAQFHNEEAAYAFVEARIWPEGPVCPHCGGFERISKMQGKSTRIGVHKCYDCRKPFTVKVGTIFESSHVPLRLWLQAIFLIASSKKGISSNQLHRTLGVTLKTAWFMSHRIREAMQSGDLPPMGGEGEVVEVDETYIGRKTATKKARAGFGHKNAVMTLVQRGGEARSFHIDGTTHMDMLPIIRANIARETRVMTDEARVYRHLDSVFTSHESVNHGIKEYVRGDVHTNTVEGFYSVFKRGMKGVYQHCGEQHLHRYIAEFDFRYSNRVALGINDEARTLKAIRGAEGKRLMYQEAH